MRGGRGGRGGSSGRRYGRGSYIQDFIRDSLEDIGDTERFDDDKSPAQLYPPIALPQPQVVLKDEQLVVRKHQELCKWFNKSPYYLSRKVEETDTIQRYSDKYLKMENQGRLYDHIDITERSQIPYELLADVKKVVTKSTMELLSKSAIEGNMETLFQRLESSEKASAATAAGGGTVKPLAGEESKDNLSEAEAAEGDLDGDYGVDYYASDNEDDFQGGGDDDYHEPTY